MRRVRFVFPTAWDRKQIAAMDAAARGTRAVEFAAPDDIDCPDDFDVLGFVATAVASGRAGLAGVTSSSDYPGAVVAAAIATGLGLPGADPAAVLLCGNKYAARMAMRAAVPEATPAFVLVEPPPFAGALTRFLQLDATLPLPAFPLFVKPVKGAFSMHSRLVADAGELDAFLARRCIGQFTRDYLRLHHRLQTRYAPQLPSACCFIAEEILRGDQVTVEGFATGGTVTILGIVDSVMHPGTRSFTRFEYPSALPRQVQARMQDIVQRVIAALGLDNTLFNVEMTWDPGTDRIGILEVNPRMCGEFADLYAKVDGTHSYAVAMALAAGERPVVRPGAGPYRFAASVPQRVFTPTRVLRAPTTADVAAAEALFPGTLVWVECATADTLCDFDSIEDGSSARYAVVNVGADDRAAVLARAQNVVDRLRFRLEPRTDGGAGDSPRPTVHPSRVPAA